LGPLVLALLPMAGVGQLAKGYASNVMIWNAWGILYATFGSLITALQFNRIDQVTNQGFLSGFFQGTSDSIVLGLVSIFYALALGLIPLIAKRLISGDVGSSAFSMLRAGAAAAGALVSGVSGFASGAGAAFETGSASGAGASALSATTATTAITSSSSPPPQPSLAQTIRTGIMSAVNSGAPPVPPSRGASNAKDFAMAANANAVGAGTAVAARSSVAAPAFRPIGVTQTLAFHAGRLAGSLASGTDRGNERESA
jgi:hypothetical protein